MMKRFLATAVVFLVASLVRAEADDKAVKKELKAMQGEWKLVAVEVNGEPIPKDKMLAISFVLEADGKSTVQTPDGKFQTQSTIDPTRKPKTIDIEYLGGRFKDKKQYGIYKLDGDRMTVVSTGPGGKPEDRPSGFKTKGTKAQMVVWERVKPDKKR
jgi:uncharacterized protein (TIGR03067 family)